MAIHLKTADFQQTAWKNLKLQIADDLATARSKLEQPGTDPALTENLRGRIAALKQLQGLEAAAADAVRTAKRRSVLLPTSPDVDPSDTQD